MPSDPTGLRWRPICVDVCPTEYTSNGENGKRGAIQPAEREQVTSTERNGDTLDRPSSYPTEVLVSGSEELRENIDRIIRCYMPAEEQLLLYNGNLATSKPRICGDWVETLPDLVNTRSTRSRDCVLKFFIRAFGLSVAQNSPGALILRPESSQAYYQATRALRRSFDPSAGRFIADMASAIMCLGLTEVSFPRYDDFWRLTGTYSISKTSLPLSSMLSAASRILRIHWEMTAIASTSSYLYPGFRRRNAP